MPVPAVYRSTHIEGARRLLARWKDDPVRFAAEALRLRVWSRQADLLRAVATHKRVAVRSGHKIGKSSTFVILALWFITTRRRARVVMTSASYRQVRDILWKELRRIVSDAPIPIGGKLATDPETGLQLPDGREIVGLSTNEPERIAGYSGPEMLFLLDEASGISEEVFEALEGNRAGGARIVLASNPTKTAGTFFDAFHRAAEFWHTIHVSSEDTPNVTGAEDPIPGLATAEWVSEKRREWGEDSALYQVRVRGNFPSQGEKAVVSLTDVVAAVGRWQPEPTGDLSFGLDVARFGDDESVLAPRRGRTVLPVTTFAKLDGPDLAGRALEIVRELRRPGEVPVVAVDVIGVGASAFDVLARSTEVRAVAVNVSESATTEGYHALRDQLWGSLRDFLRTDGAIPDDSRLQAEILAPEYGFDAQGRMKVESKEAMKKRLGRSPDRADAVALSIYQPPSRGYAGFV